MISSFFGRNSMLKIRIISTRNTSGNAVVLHAHTHTYETEDWALCLSCTMSPGANKTKISTILKRGVSLRRQTKVGRSQGVYCSCSDWDQSLTQAQILKDSFDIYFCFSFFGVFLVFFLHILKTNHHRCVQWSAGN